jgi:hypothetical protein
VEQLCRGAATKNSATIIAATSITIVKLGTAYGRCSTYRKCYEKTVKSWRNACNCPRQASSYPKPLWRIEGTDSNTIPTPKCSGKKRLPIVVLI